MCNPSSCSHHTRCYRLSTRQSPRSSDQDYTQQPCSNGTRPTQSTRHGPNSRDTSSRHTTTATGAGTMGDEGYHGAANVDGGDYPDDDSLQSIMQSVQNMHLSNNAATQQTNNAVSTLATSMASIQQALLATQQQLALLTQGGMANTGGWKATPPIPAYIQL